jgi:hypothetical protein
VRDLIADLIATLVFRAPAWTAEETLTLGIATPWVAGQISALCGKWALKIAKLLNALIETFGELAILVRKVDEFTTGINARPRGSHYDLGDGASGGHPRDLDNDGRPDALDPDADGNGVLDDLNGDGIPDIPPRLSGGPDLPTTPLLGRYAGETDAATATSIFGIPSNGVRYLTPDEAEEFRVFIRDGVVYKASNGSVFDTTSASSVWGGNGKAIFVMDSQGNLYASPYHKPGDFHHSSFLAGQPVAGAGEIAVDNGKVIFISDKSGHYTPTPNFRQQVLDQLAAQGVDVSTVNLGSW